MNYSYYTGINSIDLQLQHLYGRQSELEFLMNQRQLTEQENREYSQIIQKQDIFLKETSKIMDFVDPVEAERLAPFMPETCPKSNCMFVYSKLRCYKCTVIQPTIKEVIEVRK